MPVVLLERLPLPSLRTYTSISIALLGCAVYYAVQIVHDGHVELEEAKKNASRNSMLGEDGKNVIDTSSALDTGQNYIQQTIDVLFEETWCVWTLINMAYCCFILFGKVIQGAVFGELRVSEQQHIKDKFWNFVFYKFIFIFGVMNVQHMDEVMMWSAWFSVLGFLHLLSQLCKDRFEYLSFSPTTPGLTHAKVLLLLLAIILMVAALSIVCCMIGFVAGINTFAFMFAECALLGIKCVYVMVRYAIHLWDLNHDGVWENRAFFVYWSEFTCEITSLAIDFIHHLHMLVWSNIFLSMASLVICMQLRYLFHEGQRRLRRHKNYLRVVNTMQASFPMASNEEIDQNNDDCAICWDKMESARKLPCGHLFHNSCLRSWLEQDTSCPTCRMSLSEPMDGEEPRVNVPGAVGGQGLTGEQERPINHTTTNHFFHFDGSRYVSWFPSFSVEVTHTPILGNGPRPTQIQTSQLDNMARDVQSVFPHMPLNVIIEDLRVTKSVELTIENIIEERLVAPPTFQGRSLPNAAIINPAENLNLPQASIGGGDGPSSSALSSSSVATEEPVFTTPLPLPHEEPSSQTADILVQARGAGDSSPIAMSSNNNINFIHDESVPDLSSDSEQEDEPFLGATSAIGPGTGYRFSKSSTERHKMLMQRKQDLFEQAKKKYLSQNLGVDLYGSHDSSSEDDGLYSSDFVLSHHSSRTALSFPEGQEGLQAESRSSSDDARRRRELAYQAAQRRMKEGTS